MPLPLAMMIPFMGIQSAVMAKQFGENFQYGKRRISAMSNEEFNKLTPKMIQDNANRELKEMIPSMEQSVIEMRTFQTFLVKEFLRMVDEAIRAGVGEIFGFSEETLHAIEDFIEGPFHTPHGPSTAPPPQTAPLPPQVEQPKEGVIPPPPLEVPKEVPIIQPTPVFLFNNAQGRLFPRISRTRAGSSTVWIIQSRFGGKWNNLQANSSLERMLSFARSSWPSPQYRIYKSLKITYWMLTSKVP